MRHFQQEMLAAAIAALFFCHAAMADDTTPAAATESLAATEATDTTAAVKYERLLHLVATAGLSLGGDTIVTVTFSNGDEEKITAGGLIYISGGLGVDIPNSNWSAQVLGGYHMNQTTADNGELTFDRTTLDAQIFYRFGNGNHRIGGGLVQHSSPEFIGHIDGQPDIKATFDDAQGFSVEYNWLPAKIDFPFKESRLGFSLRAVSIDYEAKTLNGLPAQKKTFSGNHVAAGLYLYL